MESQRRQQGWRGGSGRASRLRDRDQRHSGHSLVLSHGNEATLDYLKTQACAFTQAHSLRRSTHPLLPRAWGQGLIIISCSACNGHTNERSCITVSFSKKSKPAETNDPQCKEDDIALAFQDHEEECVCYCSR